MTRIGPVRHRAGQAGPLADNARDGYNDRVNMPLKVVKMGNSAAVVLPRELMARLRVSIGDMIYVSEAPEGAKLTACNPDFAAKMAAAERIMREDRDILHVLAQ